MENTTTSAFLLQNTYDAKENMPVTTLSLLDEARLRHPGRSDIDCIERVAAEIIDELAERPPVSLEVVASFRDIRCVRVEPLPFAGSLTPEPSGLVMRLNSLDGRRRRRFSGFHEIGHTFQPGYLQQTLFRCTHRPPRPPGPADPEDLADAAAAELLLPERHFRADLAAVDRGWDGVSVLADHYDASLYATALRAVRFASSSTLLVVFEPGFRKEERGRPDATAKLRVVTSRANGSFPFIPGNKSASPGGPIARALSGEDVETTTSLADLGLADDRGLHVSARLFPYADPHGEIRQRVMALYRQLPNARR